MAEVQRFPNIRALIDPFIGKPYDVFLLPEYSTGQNACWGLVRYLLKEGLQIDLAANPAETAKDIVEVWWEDDPRDPLSLVQPWDGFILHVKGEDSDHVGLVVDECEFVHVRRRLGVVIERMQHWRHALLQIARLRQFV